MKTTEAATGKWEQVLKEICGFDSEVFNGRHQPCPCSGNGEDRFRWANRNGSGNYFCACSDGEKGGMGLLMCQSGMAFVDAARRVDEVIGNTHDTPSKPRQTYYSAMLRSRTEKSTRSAYLESRGLHVPPGIEFCREVDYRHDDGQISKHPAMLAPIMRAGEFKTYHVTYLNRGQKAAVPTPRKILPGEEMRGGACPLYPAAESMGIAEGVETAIAASMVWGMPVWAALNTSLLKHFAPPPECKHLTIFGDNDRNFAGHAAAYHLAHRLRDTCEVMVLIPEQVDTDWNDVLLAQQEKAA